MRDLIVHIPTGTVLDLAQPDYGHPDGVDIIGSCYGNIRRSAPVLQCGKHGSPIYLQQRSTFRGSTTKTMCGVHFDGTRCSPPSTGMSDEHKRQTEYIVRAAEDAGHRAKAEVKLRSSRPDAVLYGSELAIGVEVQRAQISRSAARTRTAKAITSGLSTSVWFNDRDATPAWFFHVPSIGMNRLPWDVLPRPRSATVTTGLRNVRAVACGAAEIPLCPDKKTRRSTSCGRHHAIHEPWLGMTVDDVAAMAPAGQIIPLTFRATETLLVSPSSRDLYEELLGRPTTTSELASPDRVVQTDDRVECAAPDDDPRDDMRDLTIASPPSAEQTMCCGQHYPGRPGEQLILACQLCPNSPTYWRLGRAR